MKIYKKAGVEDFMGGIKDYDLSQMPEENQLTNEQKDKIRENTLNSNNPSMKLKYFLRYPNTAYLSIWDIEKCILWGEPTDSVKQALYLWLQKERISYGIPFELPNWAYQMIIDNFSKKIINEEIAGYIIAHKDNFPDFFVQFIEHQYPEISKSMRNSSIENRRKITKQYIEFPSEENLSILTNIQANAEIDKSNPNLYKLKSPNERELSFEMNQYLMENWGIYTYIDKIIKNNYDQEWYINATEMLDELYEIQRHLDAETFFHHEGNPFILVFTDSNWGKIRTVFLGNKVIDPIVIYNSIKILENIDSNSYVTMYWGDSKTMDSNQENEEILPNSIYLIENKSDGNMNSHDIANAGHNIAKIQKESWNYNDNYITNIKKAIHINPKEEADMFDTWINNKIGTKKLTDEQYLEIVSSPYVKEITEKAGTDLFSSKIQDAFVLDEEYDPNYSKSWREVWPFSMNSAFNLWSKIPVNVRAAAANDSCSWFVYMSGLFPCNVVLEKARRYIMDTKKVINHIQCLDGTEKIREILIKEIEVKEKDIENKIRNKMSDFLQSDAVKKHKLSDFPEVFDYAKKILQDNISNEMTYDYSNQSNISKIEKSINEIGETNIYFIDENKYMNFLGEDGVKYFSASPKDANGFFVSGYSMFGENSSIIIFTRRPGSESLTSEKILEELGIKPYLNDLSLSEENTLWHEVSHAFLDQIVYGKTELHKETPSEWLKSPQEISAITYGNLQHIKRKIKQYFESIFPFPERITQGLLNQIKFDIIDMFSWEFQGMNKQEALLNIKQSIPEFDQNAIDAMESMSKEEQINMMTNMFTEFFMRKMMRSKVEDQLKSEFESIGKDINTINFQEKEVVVPEEDIKSTYSQDEIIQELSKRNDYQEFLNQCKQSIKNAYNNYDLNDFISTYRPYISKNNPQTIHPVFQFEDLLLLMFGPPATISSVNVESTNPLFSDFIPTQLLMDVKEIVKRKRDLLSNQIHPSNETPISPDEAEEAGKFITEMDQDYGPNWMWVARNKNTIKIFGNNNNWYNTFKCFKNL